MTGASGGGGAARRGARSRRAILDATLELAARRGYGSLTIEAVAAAAGVGKPTIYRWWPSKGALALDALDDAVGDALDFPDTGDVAADLAAQIGRMVALFGGDLGTVFRGVIAEGQSSPEIAAAVRDTVLEPRTRACQVRLAKAVAEGQLRDDVPTRAMVEMLYAPFFYRALLGTDVMTVRQVPEIIGRVLDGLRPAA
ncbi:TetR/AcrR family transcriptional regulator [Actinomadura rupiterrae]|uniref:TetR/AcrR family transcriptional regulator n=1 Tax=Actinomadura rupiterrae TaxID=559627 RepID=UPI0020A45E87|nr:TetR/AcrR family transcriptional regulator [Actinomadura rupiterrae]MCP2338662.1 AcrR family transcriptional regulator [Actinomadura rupiterrae]